MNNVTRYILSVTGGQREALRHRSSAVFANRYFVEVVTGIAVRAQTDDLVTVRMLAAHTGLTDGLVKLVVARLVKADLLLSQPPDRPRGPRFHQIQRAGGRWDALVDLCALLTQEAAAEASR